MVTAPEVIVPLTTLPRGSRATVCRRDMTCADCELLNAMGLRDACELRVCRGGSTCIVQVERTRIGLSKSMASRVMVRPIS